MKKKLIKKFLLFISISSLFLSCENKNQTKPELELSFTNKLELTNLSELENLIGTNSESEESFGEKRNILIFFSEQDCGTCIKVKPVIERWILQSKIKIYEYKEDNSTDFERKKNFLKKLGSENGTDLTAGRLIAFKEGKRMGSISGTFDIGSPEKIENFVSRYFSLPDDNSLKISELKKLNGIKELRKNISENKIFLLYFERISCPDCKQLSDTNQQNMINKLAKNYSGSLYKIITEESIEELSKEVIVDGKKYKSSFDYWIASGTDKLLWPEDETIKKKTEFLEMIVALGEVNPFPEDDEKFLKEIDSFAKIRRDKFLYSDRNVPSFAYVNPSENFDKKKCFEILQSSYIESKMMDEEKIHRLNFLNYFSPNNAELNSIDYQIFLITWLKILENS